MIGSSLSRRYAKAIFALALEERKEEETGREIEDFIQAYSASPLQVVLNNPAFSLRSRNSIVVEVAQGLKLSPLVTHFLCLLLERDRLGFLWTIALRYRRLLDEKKGRVEIRIVSASPLEEALRERLREVLRRVSGKEVILQEESDPGLIGGIVIHLEGKVYDGSVRTQLEKLKGRMEHE